MTPPYPPPPREPPRNPETGKYRCTAAERDAYLAEVAAWKATCERLDVVALARRDPSAGVPYFLRDERTGEPTELVDIHREFLATLDANRFVVVRAAPNMGKTQLGIGWAAHRQGRAVLAGEVPPRVTYFSDAESVAARNAASHAAIIDADGASNSAVSFRELFPMLKKGRAWGMDTGYYLDTPAVVAKDPSVVARGMKSQITGARIDIAIIDDLINQRTCLTPARRRAVYQFILNAVYDRLEPEHGRIVILTNAWHEDDASALFARKPDWVEFVMPVEREGVPTWSLKWSHAAVAEFRANNEAHRRILDCVRLRINDTNRFAGTLDRALEAGRGMALLRRAIDLLTFAPEWRIVIGCDLAFARPKRHHNAEDAKRAPRSVFAVGARNVDTGAKRLCALISGQYLAHEWYGMAKTLNVAWTLHGVPPKFIVESNAAQEWVAQTAGTSHGLDVEPFYTGSNKHDPNTGVDSLASDFHRCEWAIPNDCGDVAIDDEVALLVEDMQGYDPVLHMGDRLSAFWQCASGLRASATRAHGVATAGEVMDEALKRQEAEGVGAGAASGAGDEDRWRPDDFSVGGSTPGGLWGMVRERFGGG